MVCFNVLATSHQPPIAAPQRHNGNFAIFFANSLPGKNEGREIKTEEKRLCSNAQMRYIEGAGTMILTFSNVFWN